MVKAGATQMQLPWADNMRGKGPVQQELLFMTAASENLGKSLDSTSAKATGLRSKLSAFPRFAETTVRFGETGLSKVKGAWGAIPTELKIGVLFMVAQWSVEKIFDSIDLMFQYAEARDREGRAHAGAQQTINKAREEFAHMGQPVPQEIWKGQAQATLFSLNRDDQMKRALGGWTFSDHFKNFLSGGVRDPYVGYSRFDPLSGRTKQTLQERAPELGRNPEIMAELRKLIDSWKLPTEQRERVDKALQAAFPESFAKASEMLASQMSRLSDAASTDIDQMERFAPPLSQLTDSMGRLNYQTGPLSDSFRSTQSSASQLPHAFDSAGGAAQGFAERVNSLDLTPPIWTPPVAQPQPAQPQSTPLPKTTGYAAPTIPPEGGTRSTTARVTEPYTQREDMGSALRSFTFDVALTVDGFNGTRTTAAPAAAPAAARVTEPYAPLDSSLLAFARRVNSLEVQAPTRPPHPYPVQMAAAPSKRADTTWASLTRTSPEDFSLMRAGTAQPEINVYGSLDGVGRALRSLIGRVNSLEIIEPTLSAQLYPSQSAATSSKRVDTAPASLTHRSPGEFSNARQATVTKREMHFHAPLLVIQGSAPAAANPEALADALYARLAHEEQIAEERA